MNDQIGWGRTLAATLIAWMLLQVVMVLLWTNPLTTRLILTPGLA